MSNGIEMYGVNWIEYSNEPGVGEPLYGQVHSLRQIRCMKGPRCQVCGERFPADEPTTWVLNNSIDRLIYENPEITRQLTQTPPTCKACIPAAILRCPHLIARAPVVLSVSKFNIWGVEGDLYASPDLVQRGHVLPLGHRYLPWLLGRQLVVELESFIETPFVT